MTQQLAVGTKKCARFVCEHSLRVRYVAEGTHGTEVLLHNGAHTHCFHGVCVTVVSVLFDVVERVEQYP